MAPCQNTAFDMIRHKSVNKSEGPVNRVGSHADKNGHEWSGSYSKLQLDVAIVGGDQNSVYSSRSAHSASKCPNGHMIG